MDHRRLHQDVEGENPNNSPLLSRSLYTILEETLLDPRLLEELEGQWVCLLIPAHPREPLHPLLKCSPDRRHTTYCHLLLHRPQGSGVDLCVSVFVLGIVRVKTG